MVTQPFLPFYPPKTSSPTDCPYLNSYKAQVDIDLSNSLSYGQTVVNTKGGTVLENQVYYANMTIITALNGRGFKDYLMECVS